MAHSSNRERIARAAEEARLTKLEKAKKSETKVSARPRAKRVVQPVRMKIIWEVCTATGSVAAVFAYQDKALAEAKATSLTNSTGRNHALKATKVPME